MWNQCSFFAVKPKIKTTQTKNLFMANEWKNVRQHIKAFRSYISGLSDLAKTNAHSSYVLTKEEIDALLNQRGDGTKLNAIRIYFGAEMINGDMVPRIYAVGSDFVNNSYDDYNVPQNNIDLETATIPAANAAMPLKGNVLPCPNFCPKTNVLNN